MPGLLNHSPAKVIRQLLVNQGYGTDPGNVPLQAWPVYYSGEPDTPDSVVTVYDTAGPRGQREMVTGERLEHYGIQVRVRSAAHDAGWAKANAIAVAFDKDTELMSVAIGSSRYTVYAITRTTSVIDLGRDVPTGKRNLFTLNALVALRQTS